MTLLKKDRGEIEKIVRRYDKAEETARKADDNIIFMFSIIMSVVILLFAFWIYYISFDKTQDQELRSFELAKYNFTEEECVENKLPENTTIVAPKSKDGYWVYCTTVTTSAGSSNYCGLTKENPSPCTLYCHQTQVEVGKECRNETKIIIESFRDDKDCNTTKCEKGICTSTLLKCIIVKQVNETVCTPTYRTERGFCATAEEIVKAKELGK